MWNYLAQSLNALFTWSFMSFHLSKAKLYSVKLRILIKAEQFVSRKALTWGFPMIFSLCGTFFLVARNIHMKHYVVISPACLTTIVSQSVSLGMLIRQAIACLALYQIPSKLTERSFLQTEFALSEKQLSGKRIKLYSMCTKPFIELAEKSGVLPVFQSWLLQYTMRMTLWIFSFLTMLQDSNLKLNEMTVGR